jgi:LPXTG-motif cell wall-anchored protein
LATSQRVLGFAIFALLVAAIATAVVKGPGEDPLTIGPTTSPTPSETFTFPGPVPTETETQLFPTATETAAGPEVSPGEGEELPRTGGGSLLWPAALTLALAVGGGVLVRRTARSVS